MSLITIYLIFFIVYVVTFLGAYVLKKKALNFLKYIIGETSLTPLSPGSPAEDSSEDPMKYNKPRLQRSKAQSRKTFRLRKSRKSRVDRIEVRFKERKKLETVCLLLVN